MVLTSFGSALQTLVRDAGNNPVSGVTVTFAAPGSWASGTFASGPDGDGGDGWDGDGDGCRLRCNQQHSGAAIR